jgi:hypothetical protein
MGVEVSVPVPSYTCVEVNIDLSDYLSELDVEVDPSDVLEGMDSDEVIDHIDHDDLLTSLVGANGAGFLWAHLRDNDLWGDIDPADAMVIFEKMPALRKIVLAAQEARQPEPEEEREMPRFLKAALHSVKGWASDGFASVHRQARKDGNEALAQQTEHMEEVSYAFLHDLAGLLVEHGNHIHSVLRDAWWESERKRACGPCPHGCPSHVTDGASYRPRPASPVVDSNDA